MPLRAAQLSSQLLCTLKATSPNIRHPSTMEINVLIITKLKLGESDQLP